MNKQARRAGACPRRIPNLERVAQLKQFDAAYGTVVCGVDEAGRGPLAGPVVAAAVVLHENAELGGLDDSKKLSPKKREALYDKIMECADVGIGIVDEKEIDRINILQATLKAMELAVADMIRRGGLCLTEVVIVDGNTLPSLPCKAVCVTGADAKSANVAAASVCAKVVRDRMMVELAEKYPAYGFDKHKGYGTKAHMDAIRAHGPCEIHRKTFIRRI